MKKTKSVAYCRVACYDKMAMENQIMTINKFAESKDFTITEYYCDNGENGLTLDKPGLNKLLADIKSGKVKTVIAKDISRLVRGHFELISLLDEIKSYGVTLITVIDGKVEPIFQGWLKHMISLGA